MQAVNQRLEGNSNKSSDRINSKLRLLQKKRATESADTFRSCFYWKFHVSGQLETGRL